MFSHIDFISQSDYFSLFDRFHYVTAFHYVIAFRHVNTFFVFVVKFNFSKFLFVDDDNSTFQLSLRKSDLGSSKWGEFNKRVAFDGGIRFHILTLFHYVTIFHYVTAFHYGTAFRHETTFFRFRYQIQFFKVSFRCRL
jgi:hypothetical protein